MRCISLLLFCSFAMTVSAQTLAISIEQDQFQIDEDRKLILSHINEIEQFANLETYATIEITFGDYGFLFEDIPALLEYSNSYIVLDGSEPYTLYFTQLPIISIDTEYEIIDEPKVPAELTYSDGAQSLSSSIGIELRGGYSQSFPKKTYDLELWEDEFGEQHRDLKFGNLRSDDDWVLDALYNEPLRIRSYLSHKLWLQIHQPHYLIEEPEAKAGADVEYVEVFLNGEYNGVYLLSEQIDKKQLQIKGYNGEIRGELYKSVTWGASTYGNAPGFDNTSDRWGGYEVKYPRSDDTINWQNLYDFTDFVVNGSDADFETQIWDRFNRDNCLDYYLYLNLIKATDNTGKNIYVARYDANWPYFNVPWDLDGTWGLRWDGIYAPSTHNILSNGLYDRLIELNVTDFNGDLGARWSDYRTNIFSNNTLENGILDAYYYLLNNSVYEREAIVYPNYPFDEAAKTYTLDWLHDRLIFLDDYFYQISDTEEEWEIDNQEWIIFPNPARDHIIISKEMGLTKELPYQILDSSGALIKKGMLKTDGQLDLPVLPSGLYWIRLEDMVYKLVMD